MKYTIVKINKLQEKLNMLINSSIDILCNLFNENKCEEKQISLEKVKEVLDKSPLDFDNHICKTIYNGCDPDSAFVTWKHYCNTYKRFVIKDELEINHQCLWLSKNRYYITFDYPQKINENSILYSTTCYLEPRKNIGIGGDCCFNFNANKLEKLLTIIKNDTDKNFNNDAIEKLLKSCFAMHHSLLNFSMMPKNGYMNNVKSDGVYGLDRFDTFISALDLYFKEQDNPVVIKLIAEFETSQNSLVPFLKSIGSFENYLELFYPELLEENENKNKKKNQLCNNLIESGKKPINEFKYGKGRTVQSATERVLEYIELAIRFWEAKLDYYNKQNPPKNLNK